MDTNDQQSCPHCGGTIKATAVLCKHCKRRTDAPVAAPHQAAPEAPGPAKVSAIGARLRGYLTAKNVANAGVIDHVFLAHPQADAGVLLGHLQAAGTVAQAQVALLTDGFREAQTAELNAVLTRCLKDGLVTEEGMAEARSGFDAHLLAKSAYQHLIDSGRLTAGQAQRIEGELTGAFAAVGRAVGGLATVSGALGGTAAKRRKMMLIGGIIAAAMLGTVALGVGVLLVAGRSPPLRPECTMGPSGVGDCVFTNPEQSTAGSVCGRITVLCLGRTRSSGYFCSGEVAPASSVTMRFTVGGMARIRGRGNWADNCAFDWVPSAR